MSIGRRKTVGNSQRLLHGLPADVTESAH